MTTNARVDAIVNQIAYAQAHGARAVLAEAIRDGDHLHPDVRTYVDEAHQVACRLEALTRTIGEIVKREDKRAKATTKWKSSAQKESDRRQDERIIQEQR